MKFNRNLNLPSHLHTQHISGVVTDAETNEPLTGARELERFGFSEKITRLIAGHVQAKRYLVSTDPVYYEGLSKASRITLEKQGGFYLQKNNGRLSRIPCSNNTLLCAESMNEPRWRGSQ